MRLRERFQRFMYGRYGHDKLGFFCFITYFVLYFITMIFFRRSPVSYTLYGIGYVIIILYFFRFFSKNIYKRQRENQKYLENFWKSKKLL